MRAKALLVAIGVFILVALACGLPRTPATGVSETAVTQTAQAQLAVGELTNTPPPGVTGSPAPAVTDTPTPSPSATHTPAPTATPCAPTDTPTVTPIKTPVTCAFIAAPEFKSGLYAHPEIRFALGCPAGEQQQTWAAQERFQHGRMFWQQDTEMIHVLYDDTGAFQVESDQYVEGDPQDACPEVGDAPAGLFKPVRGFNWQWCNTAGVRAELGWALEEEMGCDAVWQEFEHGHVLQNQTGSIFIFHDDGTWDYIE